MSKKVVLEFPVDLPKECLQDKEALQKGWYKEYYENKLPCSFWPLPSMSFLKRMAFSTEGAEINPLTPD